jgi:hypothetical protein
MFGKDFTSDNYVSLIKKLNELSNMGNEGALIVLEINPQDYLLSPLVHLVEQNNAKVLHVFTYMEEETSKQIIILKIDLEDASPVLRSLERFDYKVRYSGQKQEFNDEVLRNRLNELMYYLEM